MSEMILPGTYIEVRPEGLIVPGRVTVNNVGMVGTAGKGPTDTPVLLGSYNEAREVFGDYDAWIDGQSNELTLVRALQQAFAFGATTVWAVRIADGAEAASFMLASAGGDCVNLEAKSEGEWGNEIEVNVTDADTHSFVSGETHAGGGAITLNYQPVVASGRNRISLFVDATQRARQLNIIYSGTPDPGQVRLDTDGTLTFHADDEPDAADTVTASYVVNMSASVKVTLRLDTVEEVYSVANGNSLAAAINQSSTLANATPAANASELPQTFASAGEFLLFGTGSNTRGDNGVANVDAAEYTAGLDLLLAENAHIIVAAGQDHVTMGNELAAHCKVASSDLNKRERIGITGSGLDDDFDDIRGHALDSDRIVFVAPGIETIDAPSGNPVTLPGAYTAAAVAGLMASYSAHVSLTNKPLSVRALEENYTNTQLTQLVQANVLAIQKKQAIKVLKGITTSSNTAWHQITTRRIVDYAKYGVRSAADPYIGLLNNERVRGALRATINSFLAEMVEDEMLISYDLEVSATREEERKGIARVIIVLRPVFSIDFIKVTMFLE
jgi:hypothetical protein